MKLNNRITNLIAATSLIVFCAGQITAAEAEDRNRPGVRRTVKKSRTSKSHFRKSMVRTQKRSPRFETSRRTKSGSEIFAGRRAGQSKPLRPSRVAESKRNSNQKSPELGKEGEQFKKRLVKSGYLTSEQSEKIKTRKQLDHVNELAAFTDTMGLPKEVNQELTEDLVRQGISGKSLVRATQKAAITGLGLPGFVGQSNIPAEDLIATKGEMDALGFPQSVQLDSKVWDKVVNQGEDAGMKEAHKQTYDYPDEAYQGTFRDTLAGQGKAEELNADPNNPEFWTDRGKVRNGEMTEKEFDQKHGQPQPDYGEGPVTRIDVGVNRGGTTITVTDRRNLDGETIITWTDGEKTFKTYYEEDGSFTVWEMGEDGEPTFVGGGTDPTGPPGPELVGKSTQTTEEDGDAELAVFNTESDDSSESRDDTSAEEDGDSQDEETSSEETSEDTTDEESADDTAETDTGEESGDDSGEEAAESTPADPDALTDEQRKKAIEMKLADGVFLENALGSKIYDDKNGSVDSTPNPTNENTSVQVLVDPEKAREFVETVVGQPADPNNTTAELPEEARRTLAEQNAPGAGVIDYGPGHVGEQQADRGGSALRNETGRQTAESEAPIPQTNDDDDDDDEAQDE